MQPRTRAPCAPTGRSWLARAAALLLAGLVLAAGLPASAAAAPSGPPVPLLWKATGEQGALYLLGSFHLLKPDDYPLSPDIDAALADVDALLLELAPDELSSPALAAGMGAAALRADGTRLDDQLPHSTRLALQRWAAANAGRLAPLGLDGDALQRFEPWFVALTVSLLEMTGIGLDPALGLDRHLAARAAAAGIPASGLETGAEQLRLLDGMPAELQLRFLDDALRGARAGPSGPIALHRAWRQGDAERLWRELAAEMRTQQPQLYQRINVDRNRAWLPRLQRLLDADGGEATLVVVGALHLLGEDGLVEGLRQRGYRVERICTACGQPASGGR